MNRTPYLLLLTLTIIVSTSCGRRTDPPAKYEPTISTTQSQYISADVSCTTSITSKPSDSTIPITSPASTVQIQTVETTLPPGLSTSAMPSKTPTTATAALLPTTIRKIHSNLSSDQIEIISSSVERLINQERQKAGVRTLNFPAILHQAAMIRATECIKNNGHIRPDGSDWTTIFTDVEYGIRKSHEISDDGVNWRTEVYYDVGSCAENLDRVTYDIKIDGAFSGSSADLDSVALNLYQQWVNSPGHYQNMINPDYSNAGIACAVSYTPEYLAIKCINLLCEN